MATSPRASTPTGLGSPSGKRAMTAWNEVLEICKKGFAAKMNTMGEEILRDVRLEVRSLLTGMLSTEFPELIDRQMVKLSDKIDLVRQTTDECLMRIDVSAIVGQFEAGDARQSEASRQLRDNMEERFEHLGVQLDQLQTLAEQEGERSRGVAERLEVMEGQLAKLSDANDTILGTVGTSAETAEGIQHSQQQLIQTQTQFEAKLHGDVDGLIKFGATKTEVLQVSDQIQRTETALNVDFRLILEEITKIQQSLGMEFVAVAAADTSPQRDTTSKSAAESLRKSVQIADDAEVVQVAAASCDAHPPSSHPPPLERQGTSSAQLRRQATATARQSQIGLRVSKRMREYWAQTDIKICEEAACQTDPKLMEKKERKTVKKPKPKAEEAPSKTKPVFADAEAMKAKAREALVKPQFNVFDLYKTEGIFQRIAKSSIFENLSLGVVFVNACWMAIDTDMNNAALITAANPVFVVAENIFCSFFFVEVIIRFAAFAKKRRCFKDRWFVFDSVLVFQMILETWIVPIVVSVFDLGGSLQGVDLSALRMVRMVKILRLTRMVKLLRAVPELMIIVKGIGFAARSVLVFALLWMMLIFVFSVVLTQLTKMMSTTAEFQALFVSVPESINTLLMHGILPHQAALLKAALGSSPFFWIVTLAFVLLASVTIMYMLMGVLVEVMSAISSSEKEGLTVSFVATQLREKMEAMNYSTETSMSQPEFEKLLMAPEVARIISGVGVDIGVLLDMMDIIYEDLDKKGIIGLSFESMVELILNLRGANVATVKDVKELLRVVKAIFKENLQVLQKTLHEEIIGMRGEMGALRGKFQDDDDYDDDDYMPASSDVPRLASR